jgi:hypothetical protein
MKKQRFIKIRLQLISVYPLLHDLFGILVRFTQKTNLFTYGFKKILRSTKY